MVEMTVHDRYVLARRQLEAGQPLEAVRTLEPAAAELSGSASALLVLAQAYFLSAQLRKAGATLERVVELDPTDDYARFLLGRVAERRGDGPCAREHFRVAVALAPRPEYLSRLGSA